MSLVKKHREENFPYSLQDVMNACADAARQAGMTVDRVDVQRAQIFISKSTSLLSWGETIYIALSELGPQSTNVYIESDCKMGSTLIDWGVNNKNINKILEGAKKLLSDFYGR